MWFNSSSKRLLHQRFHNMKFILKTNAQFKSPKLKMLSTWKRSQVEEAVFTEWELELNREEKLTF